jgi:hypothetical protein
LFKIFIFRNSLKNFIFKNNITEKLDNMTFCKLFGKYEEAIYLAEILFKNKIDSRADPTSTLL